MYNFTNIAHNNVSYSHVKEYFHNNEVQLTVITVAAMFWGIVILFGCRKLCRRKSYSKKERITCSGEPPTTLTTLTPTTSTTSTTPINLTPLVLPDKRFYAPDVSTSNTSDDSDDSDDNSNDSGETESDTN